MWAVRLNEPLALRSLGLRIGAFGLSSRSQRTPAETVRFGGRNHWSCRKAALLLLAELRLARLVGGQAVEAAELPVLAPAAGEEVGLVVEDVDAAPVALEDLVDAGVVVVDAALEDVLVEQVAEGVARTPCGRWSEVMGRKLTSP